MLAGCALLARAGSACNRHSLDSAVEEEVCLNDLDAEDALASEEGVLCYPDGILLVVDTGNGRVVLVDRTTGEKVGEVCIDVVLPETCDGVRDNGAPVCLLFGVIHESDENGDSIALAYDRELPEGEVDSVSYSGGMVRVWPGPQHTVDWNFEGMVFDDGSDLADMCVEGSTDDSQCRSRLPHSMAVMADGISYVLADTLNNRVLMIQPEGSSGTPTVVGSINDDQDGWGEALWPNGIDVLTWNDRELLLVTYKGGLGDDAASFNAGRIMMWDVTDRANIAHLWTFPEDGYIASPHGGTIQQSDDGDWLLVYAHSRGVSQSWEGGDEEGDDALGSIGLAVFGSLDAVPEYRGELVVSEDPPLGFVRSATIIGDAMLINDSGCETIAIECSNDAHLVEVAWTLPEATGLGGGFSEEHEDQNVVAVDRTVEYEMENLLFPYVTEVVFEDELGPTLGIGLQDSCGTE